MISVHRHTLILGAIVLLSCSSSSLSIAQSGSSAPDNSKQNRSQNQTGTATSQSNVKSDRDITARVRRAIVADETLSTNAHNVKVITSNGAVTLKGPVDSDAEKLQVEKDATNAIFPDQVVNELTVKQ